MKLYFSPGACSLAVHIVCEEQSLDYEAIAVDLKTHKVQKSGDDYYAINPKGYVPMLELDDGVRLTEAAVLLQYLAALKPETRLFPTSGPALWKARETLHFLSTEIHKGFGNIFGLQRLVTKPECQNELKANTEKRLNERFNIVSTMLKGNGGDSFLLGNDFSITDAYLFTLGRWVAMTQLKLSPELLHHREKVMGRPAVQKVLKAEGLL